MAFREYKFETTPSNLEGIVWESSDVYAQLLNVTYTYNGAHDTRNDVVSAVLGSPLQLEGKTKTTTGGSTYLNATQSQFPNSIAAKFVVYVIGSASSPALSDKLLAVVDLNDGSPDAIEVNFGIGFNNGLFSLTTGA